MFIPDPGSRIRIFPSRFPDPGSKFFSSWIPDPGSEFFPSRILDPGCALKNSSILTKKSGFSALRNMIRVLHPGSGSRIWILTFYLSRIPILDPRSRIQGSKRHRIPDSGFRIRIRNTGDFGFAQAVGGSVGYWLSMGAAVLTTHAMDQLSEAFMCKKKIIRILYFHIISLIFTVFKLWCPAHLFPNTPRTLTQTRVRSFILRSKILTWWRCTFATDSTQHRSA